LKFKAESTAVKKAYETDGSQAETGLTGLKQAGIQEVPVSGPQGK